MDCRAVGFGGADSEASKAGGLLVSGGNMRLVCFCSANCQGGWDVRKTGISGSHPRLLVYASAETHTWIQKAADLFGFGTDAIRWIDVDEHQRMKTADLRRQIDADRSLGDRPFLVVGTAGSVSTGAVDPLPEIAAICRRRRSLFMSMGIRGLPPLSRSPSIIRGLLIPIRCGRSHKWLTHRSSGCARDAA